LGYNQQGDSVSFAPMVNLAKDDHAILVYASQQKQNDQETADDLTISPSEYDKQLYGLNYQYQLNNGQVGFAIHSTDTSQAGTPALPMDVDYIEANRFEFNGEHDWFNHEIVWSLSYLDAEHGMDNYALRHNMNENMYRYNTAAATSTNLKFHASKLYAFGRLTYGLDGYWSEHDSTITSPKNRMFNILNFNSVKDNRYGVFAEYDKAYSSGTWSFGLRLKQHQQDADDVDHHMAMMNDNIKMLKNNFNNADKNDTKSLHDIAINWHHDLKDNLQISVGLGQKQRAASYQELYLWLPMQSTGGLADGRTYVGDINLEPETANQLNLGLTWKGKSFQISPNLFYQKIDDYIQAFPSTNMAANMVANMMTGKMPLQFANVEAELTGFDLDLTAQLSEFWSLDMIASYVKGERGDINDNLYRVSPANLNATINYQQENWQLRLNWHLFAKQDDVSVINDEKPTSGYGLINVSGRYTWSNVQIHAGIRNLMDKNYIDHLAGTNRVMMSDIPTGNKLPGVGRDVYAALVYSF